MAVMIIWLLSNQFVHFMTIGSLIGFRGKIKFEKSFF